MIARTGTPSRFFDVFHRLDAGIEIFDEKGEAKTNHEADQRTEHEIKSDPRAGRKTGRFRLLFDADREPRHRQFHGLGLRARPDAVEKQLFLDVSVLGAGVIGA